MPAASRGIAEMVSEIDMDNVMKAVAQDCVWQVIGNGPLEGDYQAALDERSRD